MSRRNTPFNRLPGETEAQQYERLSREAAATSQASSSRQEEVKNEEAAPTPDQQLEEDIIDSIEQGADETPLSPSSDMSNHPADEIAALREQLNAAIARLDAAGVGTRQPTPEEKEQRRREQSTAFSEKEYSDRFGLAAHEDFEPYPGNGANPKFDRKAKSRGSAPQTFTGENNGKIEFGAWVAQLRDYIVSNDTYWKTERERVQMAVLHLSDDAGRTVAPRYQSQTHPFANLAELIQTLEAGYGDPMEKEKSVAKLERLHLDVGDDVTKFLTTFNGLYERSRRARSEIKDELLRRVEPTMTSNIRHYAREPKVTYERFCEHLADAAYAADLADKSQKKKRAAALAAQPKKYNPAVVLPKVVSTPPRVRFEAAPVAAPKAQEGRRCWSCDDPSHVAANCPKKPKNVSVVEIEEEKRDASSSSASDTEKDTEN